MSEEERSQGFRVTDRRRFSPESGETQSKSDPHIEMTFSSFILGLSTQVLISLGEIPNAPGQAPRTDLTAAQQMIDVLAMLQQKTSGNLDAGEGQMLESVLYDLRMRYVKLKREGHSA